jgi:hypothetical protein
VERLQSSQIHLFFKRFRFQKGKLRRIQISNSINKETQARIVLKVIDLTSNQPVLLKLDFVGVEEFRFQRRPNGGLVALSEVRFGHFNGLIYLNLDAFPEEGPLQLIDFKASDAFIGARDVNYEIVTKKA